MQKTLLLLCCSLMIIGTQCKQIDKRYDNSKSISSIKKENIDSTINDLSVKYGDSEKPRIIKGVTQAAALWTEKDGKNEEFRQFCNDQFAGTPESQDVLFNKLSLNLETLFGYYNRISIELKKPLHLDIGEFDAVDEIFGSYEPSAHFNDDFFANKLAFVTILNFPFYSLKEKTELGPKWDRKQWAYSRIGDMFTARVPSEIIQNIADATTAADTYISGYNIYMGNLVDDKFSTLFSHDLKLISHWGLRDELKTYYGKESGLENQRMIYQVMKRIILQEIPDTVVNDSNLLWDPFTNKLFSKDKKEISFITEPDTRYKYLLENFIALKKVDEYSPNCPSYIQRRFEQELEIPQAEVEKLFTDFVSSPIVKKVAAVITSKLNRKLEPFDIWYDGFKPRSAIAQEDLDTRVKSKYPTVEAFQKDLTNLLLSLGFKKEKADYITSKVLVEASRGAGHAWGSTMKGDVAHLRTRIPEDGMNYKGYNIAIHEFGHTVEQTLSLYDVDYYSLSGVPNTAFTEALAFIFQKRDLELLGMKNPDPNKEYYQTLDEFWACYEIMGVSLVDMQVWKWMYEHPNATPAELKETVISIATDVWNKYYADVFGIKDSPILAIYSHMIDAPLYLSAYPLGHLIDFQVEKAIRDKDFGQEIIRIYTYGRVTPNAWMKYAVGSELSINPMLEATDEALKQIEVK